jgi:hypothetical protein
MHQRDFERRMGEAYADLNKQLKGGILDLGSLLSDDKELWFKLANPERLQELNGVPGSKQGGKN